MKVFFIVPLISFLISCESSKDATTNNVIVAEKLFDAFNKHDWKTMASLYADSALFLDPSFGKNYVQQSHEQIEQKYVALESMFPDIKDNLGGMYADADKVTIEFISTGTSQDGFRLDLPIVTILTISNGKIIRDATYYDVENP